MPHSDLPRASARAAVRRACVAIASIFLVAACGGTAASPVPSTAAGPATASPATSAVVTPSPSPAVSKGPASAQFTLVGTAGLSGPTSTQEIICGEPSLDGPQIFYLGQAGTSGPQIVIFVVAGHVEVRAGTGSASTLRLRSFQGSGVTAFDAASGAHLDSALTEITPAGTATGDIGALSSITGTIDCGDQQPGSADVVVSGLTPYGRLDGALTSVHVGCTDTTSGVFVGISGLATAGTTPVLVDVTASADHLQVAVESKAAGTFYTGPGAGSVTLVAGGARMAGDVTESVAAGATPSPHTLHVSGSATCGTTIQP
ncbi:MAG: hypothetical protein ACHQZR_03810 [Candidatus Limnocylindrales bacterium]